MQMVSRTEGNIDDSLIGGNASAEGPEGEGTESTVITGVDIVMNHHLQETSFTKEAYKKAIKDYMKSIKGKFEDAFRALGCKPGSKVLPGAH